MPRIFIQTATGRAVDLLEPRADMIDIEGDIAPALARIPRFNGHARGANGHAYSVAQHCCHGAELLRDTGPQMALTFLLHDAHEAYLGDLTRPVQQALHHFTPAIFTRNGVVVHGARGAISTLKHRIDCAIYAAAGFDVMTPDFALYEIGWDTRSAKLAKALIADMDEAMLEFERRTFLGRSEIAWQANGGTPAPVDFTGVWPADEAEHRWIDIYLNLRLEIAALNRTRPETAS